MADAVKKILIVDDEEDVRLFLADFFVERDFQVLSAASAEEALQICEKDRPDVVLLDIMMPGMDGMQCLEHLKRKYPSMVVIMITALKDETRMAKAKKLGAADYVVKPFSLAYLETEMEKIIRTSKP